MSGKQTDAELEMAALNRVLEAFRGYRQYSVSKLYDAISTN